MSNPIRPMAPLPVRPPTRHEMAAMIWIAVFPTLTLLNLSLGGVLLGAPVVLRTLVLTTIAVPIVIYGLMPPLQRIRAGLLQRRARR
jgi:antibiotic biosynthesis monooxygenase (ABM) superfamily enzyme